MGHEEDYSRPPAGKLPCSLSLFICTCASSTFTFVHLYKFKFPFLAFGIFFHLPLSLSLIHLHNMIIPLSLLFCTAYLSCCLYFLVIHSHFLFFPNTDVIFHFQFLLFFVRKHLVLSFFLLFCTLASSTFTSSFVGYIHTLQSAFIVCLTIDSKSSANQYKSVYIAVLPP